MNMKRYTTKIKASQHTEIDLGKLYDMMQGASKEQLYEIKRIGIDIGHYDLMKKAADQLGEKMSEHELMQTFMNAVGLRGYSIHDNNTSVGQLFRLVHEDVYKNTSVRTKRNGKGVNIIIDMKKGENNGLPYHSLELSDRAYDALDKIILDIVFKGRLIRKPLEEDLQLLGKELEELPEKMMHKEEEDSHDAYFGKFGYYHVFVKQEGDKVNCDKDVVVLSPPRNVQDDDYARYLKRFGKSWDKKRYKTGNSCQQENCMYNNIFSTYTLDPVVVGRNKV